MNNQTYLAVSVLGSSLKLNIKYTNTFTVELNKKETEIDLFLPKLYKKSKNINDVINLAVKRLYDKIADEQIEYSMEIARHILKFAPEDYEFKRLTNCFCRCRSKKIIINPEIVKYSKEIIDTTIIQAFCKIKYKPNSVAYKTALKNAMEKYEIQKNSYFTIAKVS